jgi:hypothetical protein
MKVVKRTLEESTCNAWGFGGAVNIVTFVMENGDRWRSGKVCYRHLPSDKFIRAWDDQDREIGDWVLRGKPEVFIYKFYGGLGK